MTRTRGTRRHGPPAWGYFCRQCKASCVAVYTTRRYSPEQLVDLRFGGWTVIRPVFPDTRRQTYFLCRCICGTEKEIRRSHLTDGTSQSCGCLVRELISKTERVRHGHTRRRGNNDQNHRKTPTYVTWESMRVRCKDLSNMRYGGRGITVCERWNSFANFLADMGEKPAPHYQIDRIDNDGNYEPGNCRWVTPQENLLNRNLAKKKKTQ